MVSFRTNLLRALALLGFTLMSLGHSERAHALGQCGITEECTAPLQSPWRYHVGEGPWGQVFNQWFDSASEAEAAILARYGQSDWCSLSIASREVDSFQGYPRISNGIEYWHSVKVTFDFQDSVSGVCQPTNHFWVGYDQVRKVSCEQGYSLRAPAGADPAYCRRPYATPEPNKVCGSCNAKPGGGKWLGNPVEIGTGNKAQIERDYRGSGAFPLAFTRAYNSLKASDDSVTVPPPSLRLGKGWISSYLQSLWLTEWGGLSTVRALRPEGRVILFNLSGGQ